MRTVDAPDQLRTIRLPDGRSVTTTSTKRFIAVDDDTGKISGHSDNRRVAIESADRTWVIDRSLDRFTHRPTSVTAPQAPIDPERGIYPAWGEDNGAA